MLKDFVNWWSGGTGSQYMDTVHCMNHDWFWITVTIVLNLLVIAGYLLIARHWLRNEKKLKPGPAKLALNQMKYIFLFCALCGYLFPVVRMWWPCVRLSDLALVFLVYFTWAYAFNSGGLEVVYNQLRDAEGLRHRNDELASHTDDLELAKVQLETTARQLNESLEKVTRINQELSRSNEELEQFAYVASHDLKAPLRAANNLATWIQEDLSEGRNVDEHLSKLKARILHMDNLIEGLLEYSRIGRLHTDKYPVDTARLVEEAATVLPSHAVVEVRGVLPTVMANSIRLQQVLGNLMDNAVKHSNKGTPHVYVSCDPYDGGYRFVVADDGPGIEPRYHDKIFQIFQTLQPRDGVNKNKGTGIGLTLVQRIVEDWGGKIWVESEPGRGAKFIFTLPT
jgi:signal transduction histidine kinase